MKQRTPIVALLFLVIICLALRESAAIKLRTDLNGINGGLTGAATGISGGLAGAAGGSIGASRK